jgi:hypothetical protein
MDPDDEGGLVKKRGVLRWDKRKKKFIKDFDGNPNDKRGESSKKQRTEAGRKIEKVQTPAKTPKGRVSAESEHLCPSVRYYC